MSLYQFTISGLIYAKQRIAHKFKHVDDTSGEESVQGKIVVVTGGNSGIGEVVVTQMVKRNAIVIMACRDLVKAEKVIANIKRDVPDATLVLVKLDLGDLESVRNCAQEITQNFPHINILINNAGVMGMGVIERTKDGFEKNMGTNHLGHFLFTLLLLKHLKKGSPSKIVTVGSIAHENANLNVDDLNMEKDTAVGFAKLRPYNNSKLCNMLFAKELARRLNLQGIHDIKSYSICPGVVDTGLFDKSPWYVQYFNVPVMKTLGCTPEQGAETILYCALSTDCSEDTGKPYRFRRYWKESDELLSSMAEVGEKLWELSENLVGTNLAQVI